MKHLIILLALISAFGTCVPYCTSAQEFQTNQGSATFSVSAPAKTIYSKTEKVQMHADFKDAIFLLKVSINSFEFSNNFVSDSMNALIHERFNNYYLESDQYPFVTYQATITNNGAIQIDNVGSYPIETIGTLSIHGVDREVTAKGMVHVRGGKIEVEAQIVIVPRDYNIRIPDYIGNVYFKEVHIMSKAVLEAVR